MDRWPNCVMLCKKRLFVCNKIITKKRPEEFELFSTSGGYIFALLVSCYVCKWYLWYCRIFNLCISYFDEQCLSRNNAQAPKAL